MYLFPVCGAAKKAFSYQVDCLLWSGIVYYRIKYDNAMSFAPIIISKWLFISISQSSHCSADSSLTWKFSIIMALTFLFYSFLQNNLLCAASIYTLNVTSLWVLENSVGSLSLRLSLTQYINDINRFFWTRVTVNILAAGVLLAYPLQADCIPSESLTLRWPIPLGSVIMSS